MKKFVISSAAAAMAMAMSTSAMAAGGNSEYFIDVTADNYGWAVEYVDYIARNGIASGTGSDMYSPGNNIIRGDFAVLLNQTFEFKEAKLETYALKDVPADSYYAQAIANCCGGNVITDVGMYYPENDITRIDAVLMIYRALINNNLISGGLSTDVSMFADGSTISGVERQMAVSTLNSIGLINGDDKGNFNPNATMTRAEMAVVFAKLDQYKNEFEQNAAIKAEEEAQKAEEEEEIKAEEEQAQKKEEESRNYSGETVNETISASNGGSISVENSNVRVTDQAGVSADNESEINITGTDIGSAGGNAVEAKNESVITIEGGSVTGNNGIGISAESGGEITVSEAEIEADGNNAGYAVAAKGGKVTVENCEITAGDEKGAVTAGDGGELNISNSTVTAQTGSGKSTYMGSIDVISEGREHSEINLENTVIDNSKGSAFYVRESDVTINIKGGNTINTAMLINSPNIPKQEQDYGNTIELNLTDGAQIRDTRIVLDPKTELNINIDDNCFLSGQIDANAEGHVSLNIAQNATLELQSDLYLDGFIDEDSFDMYNIIDNGHNIYYSDSNPDNEWLDLKEYELMMGGRVMPYSLAPIVRD